MATSNTTGIKISEQLALVSQDKLHFSVEFFPPKTDDGVKNLEARFERYKKRGALFADCTWGAGGSTSDLTLKLCLNMQNNFGLNTCMHLTCTNMDASKIDQGLEGAKQGGIRNIFALRGDPPLGQDWKEFDGGFSCALDLVKHIKKIHGDYFCIGVAGYPEGHLKAISEVKDVATLTETERNRLITLPEGNFVCFDADYIKEIAYLAEKVQAGANYIITQMIFDADVYKHFVADCRAAGITIPILPGIMCINGQAGFIRMVNFCKSRVPLSLFAEVEAAKDDPEAMIKVGINVGAAIGQKLLEYGAPGIHFYTLNLEKVCLGVIDALDINR